MAVYKVIQDVEAEDKILGPLSLKQLIYAGVAVGLIFIAFRLVMTTGTIFIALPFLPFVFLLVALAAPLSRDQSTEIWLAAQVRFFTKPRKRLWDQDGIKELVHITVPKREEKHYTNGLDQTQVHSRLSALASTLDSRGWAVKHSDLNMGGVAAYRDGQSDRLLDPSSLPQVVSDNPVAAADDILDVYSNKTAQHFDEMMKQSNKTHKQKVIDEMHVGSTPISKTLPRNDAEASQDAPQDYYFMHESKPTKSLKKGQAMFSEAVVQPGGSAAAIADDDDDLSEAEKEALEFAKEKQKVDELQNYNHHKVVLTPAQLEQQAIENAEKSRQQAIADARAKELQEKERRAKTHLKKADTIELAKADNLKVSTIAGLAKHKADNEPDEVVINLH